MNPRKLILCLVGQGISYSRSPEIFSALSKKHTIEINYSLKDIDKKSFESTIQSLREDGYHGCNVTQPFKETAFDLADILTDNAKTARAVNTLVFQGEAILGDNTDGVGFLEDIQSLGSLNNKRILICGAGGACRGILPHIVKKSPLSVIVANRTLSKARTLTNQYDLTSVSYSDITDEPFDIIIDTTSQTEGEFLLPNTVVLSSQSFIYDLKYHSESPIIRWAKAHKIPYKQGEGMLKSQAEAALLTFCNNSR